MQHNQDNPSDNDQTTNVGGDQKQATSNEQDNEDLAYDGSEEGMANSDKEEDGLERETYINTDLISETEIQESRQIEEDKRMPDSPLSDPTQTENN